MKLIKASSVLTSVAFLACPLYVGAESGPVLFGLMSAGAVEDEKDFESEAFEMELGVKGGYDFDAAKLNYQLILDLSDAINAEEDTDGEDEIHVRRASLALVTGYGVFVIAPRAISGHWRNLYGGLDKFEYNEPHAATPVSGGGLFEQVDEGQNVLAYVSPNWNGFQAVVASLQVDEDNGKDHDVVGGRLLYWGKNWNVGFGHVEVDKAVGHGLPFEVRDDYVRDSIGFAYNFDKVELGATYERNSDQFVGADSDVFGLAGKVKLGSGWSLSLGYFDKNYDNDANVFGAPLIDDNLTVLNIKKQVHEKVSLWAETGQYDEAQDNVAFGVNVTF